MLKRLPYEAIVIAMVLLGSCSEDTTEQKAIRAESNSRRALSDIDSLKDRVDRLEQRTGIQ